MAAIRVSQSSSPSTTDGVVCQASSPLSQVSSLRDLVGRRDVNYAVQSTVDLDVLRGSGEQSAAMLHRAVADLQAASWRPGVGLDLAQNDVGVGPEAVFRATGANGHDRRASVFVGDSMSARYAAQRSCGGVSELEILADTRYFAIGLRRDDHLVRDAVNLALLRMSERGFVKRLQNK